MNSDDYRRLCDVLMDWSMKNGEYDMAYVLFTQFNTDIPVRLTYELPERKVRNMDNYDNDSKIVTSMSLWRLLEICKRNRYGPLKNGGFGYMFIS